MKIKNKLLATAALSAAMTMMPVKANALHEAEPKQPVDVEQKVWYDDSKLRSETTIGSNGVRASVDLAKNNLELGADINYSGLHLNVGHIDADWQQGNRLQAEITRDGLLLGLGYHDVKDVKNLTEAYFRKIAGENTFEGSFNNSNHLTILARRNLNGNTAVGIGGTTSTDGNQFYRAGVSASHGTDNFGVFGYAIHGKNDDGTSFTEVRARGGLGKNTTREAIGSFSVRDQGFLDEYVVDDLVWDFSDGPFGNWAADKRGDPLGFDAKYSGDTASLELAAKLGRVTIMPKVSYNTKTKATSKQAQLNLNLGKGFYAKAHQDFTSGSEKNSSYMIGFQKKF